MRRPLGYALFFGVLYLAFLVATVPATLVHGWIAARAALPVGLSGIDGTLWRGRAVSARIGPATVDGPAWTFRPGALFLGRLEFDVDAGVAGGTLRARAGWPLFGAPYARDARLNAPLNDLVMLVGEPDMGLRGRLDADIARLRLRDAPVPALEGTVSVSDAGIGPPLDLALGGLAIDLTTDDEGSVVGALRDTGGTLRAQGTVLVQQNGAWRLQAELAAREGQDDLARALAMIARPGPNGAVTVERTGILRLP